MNGARFSLLLGAPCPYAWRCHGGSDVKLIGLGTILCHFFLPPIRRDRSGDGGNCPPSHLAEAGETKRLGCAGEFDGIESAPRPVHDSGTKDGGEDISALDATAKVGIPRLGRATLLTL